VLFVTHTNLSFNSIQAVQLMKCTSSLVLRPLFFAPLCFTAPYQYTTLLNLRPLIFDLTLPDWLRSITLTPTYSIIPHGKCIFYLRPRFQEHKYCL
jgi:hypothetical protein